ncbi:hypothetical protein BAAM0483_02355 [Bifidobacterium animalis subsp. animalis MCC 0483]|uniref:XRE family transcriptional regulator n=1 Tax=Bifidobacterium animalis subsp. animalis MCC 0483 TaxID=1365955 RepID=A0AB34TB44_9BIFI|nr:helix-turn-helix transcriptional regulator [Bifidobacterium animalis]KOA51094.1 hypothetical protein BAAM0483_02355 [Bifidobacterium animalis subsp. animalis MCC 0483]
MTNVDAAQIGQNAAELRESSKMSMDDLAAAMRVKGHKWTRVTVFNVEHGKRQLKLQEAVDMLDILQFDLETGIKLLTAENPEKAEVQEYVQRIFNILNHDLPQSIFRLRLARNLLNAMWVQLLDEEYVTSPDNQLNFSSLRDACKELDVYKLLKATDNGKVLALVRDLFSVPIRDIHLSSIAGENIGIYQKEDGVPYDFVVINEMTGKEYHANRDNSGEADQANE